MTKTEIGAALDRAADALIAKGFTKHIRHDMNGKMCALGAIEDALSMTHNGEYVKRDHPVVIAFSKHVPPSPHENADARIAVWNNKDERTAEQVIATFRAAANCAKNEVIVEVTI